MWYSSGQPRLHASGRRYRDLCYFVWSPSGNRSSSLNINRQLSQQVGSLLLSPRHSECIACPDRMGRLRLLPRNGIWYDLKLSTAASALRWHSISCILVTFTDPRYYSDATSVKIYKEQYEQLVAFIEQTFTQNDESLQRPIEGYAHTKTGAFFKQKETTTR